MFNNTSLYEIAVFLRALAMLLLVLFIAWGIKKDFDIQTNKIEVLQDMVNNGAECNDLIKILDVKMD